MRLDGRCMLRSRSHINNQCIGRKCPFAPKGE